MPFYSSLKLLIALIILSNHHSEFYYASHLEPTVYQIIVNNLLKYFFCNFIYIIYNNIFDTVNATQKRRYLGNLRK